MPRRVEDRQPAVADLGGQRHVLGPLGAQHDRDVGAQRMGDRLEVLAEPGRALAGQRQRVVRAVAGHRRLARPAPGAGCRRTRGCGPAAWGTSAPYQPSTTCGPDTPSPRMCRPPDRWSSVSAAIAHAVGVRADSCTTEVPSRIRLGRRAPPGQRRVGVRAPRLGGEHGVEAGLLGRGDQFGAFSGGCAPQYPSWSPSFI